MSGQQFIHVKKLSKYHPGYKDRTLQWAKIYFNMVQGDPEFELIESEIDKWRYVALICLELQAQQPLPLNDTYFVRKGFNIENRSMSVTLKVLHNFIDIVTVKNKLCVRAHARSREEDKDKEEDKDIVRKISDKQFIELSEWYHFEVQKEFPNRTPIQTKNIKRTIELGAEELEKLYRIDKQPLKLIQAVLHWVVEDYDPNNKFNWFPNLQSLASIRKRKSAGDLTKFEKILNSYEQANPKKKIDERYVLVSKECPKGCTQPKPVRAGRHIDNFCYNCPEMMVEVKSDKT